MSATSRSRPTPERRPGGDRGQVLPLVVVLLVISLGCIIILGRVGVAARDRAHAQTAADAAALAGVAAGHRAAAAAAEANGAVLLRIDEVDGTVEVEVARGDATASARATLAVDGASPAG